jgi:hypothetical protein
MLKEKGVARWTRDYIHAMTEHESTTYYMRLGARPTQDARLSYVYLCIGGRVRYRSYYAGSSGPQEITFLSGRTMFAKAWVMLAGPHEKAPHEIPLKGFRGFRYCRKLF